MKGIILVFSILIVGIVTFWLLFSNVLFPIKYRTEILAAAKTYSIEPALIAAVINAESSFDKDKVSPKKAMGLMQLLPSTAASFISYQETMALTQTKIRFLSRRSMAVHSTSFAAAVRVRVTALTPMDGLSSTEVRSLRRHVQRAAMQASILIRASISMAAK